MIDFVHQFDVRPVEKEIEYKQADGATAKRTVKYLNLSPVYDAFIVRSDRKRKEEKVVWVPLEDSQPIDEAIAAWRSELMGEGGDRSLRLETVEKPRPKTEIPPREVLRQKVWDKLEPHLDGCHTVIVLPAGALNRLPWAALPGRKKNSYLIEDYAIGAAAYGQQLYGLLSDEPPEANQLLVAGGIDYNRRADSSEPESEKPSPLQLVDLRRSPAGDKEKKWDPLDGAKKEAQTIAALWNQDEKVIALTGAKANEAALARELSRARYAHLATHGFFAAPGIKSIFDIDLRDPFSTELTLTRIGKTGAGETVKHQMVARESAAARSPLLLSGIVLAGANLEPVKNDLGLPTGEDGILTAEEIVGLDLHNTELITLSACETGLGEVAAGEGVMNLQRALHQAGARAVVASLWKVNDNATRILMEEFYRNLWEKKIPKLEALRQAQLFMILNYNPITGKLHAGGGKRPADKKAVQSALAKLREEKQTLPPFYWAAFQLSGDWR